MTDWTLYRACPVCKVAICDPCLSMSGSIAGDQPDGIAVTITHAHASRRFRLGRTTKNAPHPGLANPGGA